MSHLRLILANLGLGFFPKNILKVNVNTLLTPSNQPFGAQNIKFKKKAILSDMLFQSLIRFIRIMLNIIETESGDNIQAWESYMYM
mgnify:CR=1 FL=1